MDRSRDLRFTDRDFRRIRELVGEHTGISLSEAKRDMVYSRLARRIRVLGLRDFSEYCDVLGSEGGVAEQGEFVNAITTNLTSFFRESHHFNYLERELLPELLQRRDGSRRLRIWSAGCSTGEEPYSLAMVLGETVPEGWDVRILATDLDSNVLETARRGVYDMDRLKAVGKARLRRWFLKGKGAHAGKARAAAELRDMVSFRQLNLMGAWPMRGPFDAIFCRNVMIYFDKPTQHRLTERFAGLLAQDGHLFVGHSETLYRVTDRFQSLGQTVYRRCA